MNEQKIIEALNKIAEILFIKYFPGGTCCDGDFEEVGCHGCNYFHICLSCKKTGELQEILNGIKQEGGFKA